MSAATKPGFDMSPHDAVSGSATRPTPGARASVYINGRFLTQRVTGVQLEKVVSSDGPHRL